ncbi:MAG: hypothetical protein AB7N76_04610 [Planctomycetota bacterium]
MTQELLEHRLPSLAPLEQRSFDPQAAIGAGLFAGAVYLGLDALLIPAFQGVSGWVPLRRIAAILLGPEALTPPSEASAVILALALLVHFTLSVSYAAIGGYLVHKVPTTSAVIAGCGLGAVLYVLNLHVLTYVFPFFADARGWAAAFDHVVFGGVAALCYKALQVDREDWERVFAPA